MSADHAWPSVRLDGYATVKARIGWKGLQANEYRDKGYIFLATPNIKGSRIDFRDVNFISERRYIESPELTLQLGDVLLVKDGSTLGISNIVRRLPGPATINGSIALLRCSERLDSTFLHQLTKAHAFQKLIHDKKSGLGVPHLFQADLRDFEIPLPPLPEQRRIAEILDTLDEAIRKTEQVIAKLQQMKQGLLHDLLTRGIDENGELRDPERRPEQFKDSPLGRIPREWEVEDLGFRFSVKGGKRLPAGHTYSPAPTGYRYLRVIDFFGKSVNIDELQHLRPQTFRALCRYEINDGDLYISIAGSIGHIGVYRRDGRSLRTILTENAARLVSDGNDVPHFVALQANHNSVQGQINVEKGTGGGVPKLALFRIEKLRFAWPSVTEQWRIVEAARCATERIRREQRNVTKLRTLKHGLMDDLLTGRVRVSVPKEAAA